LPDPLARSVRHASRPAGKRALGRLSLAAAAIGGFGVWSIVTGAIELA